MGATFQKKKQMNSKNVGSMIYCNKHLHLLGKKFLLDTNMVTNTNLNEGIMKTSTFYARAFQFVRY